MLFAAWKIWAEANGEFVGSIIRSTGPTTLESMTQALNQPSIRSARGGRWYASSVAKLLARADEMSKRTAIL